MVTLRVTGPPSSQHFVSGHRINPDTRLLHLLENPCRRRSFHRIAGLNAFGAGRGNHGINPRTKHLSIPDPERRAVFRGQLLKEFGIGGWRMIWCFHLRYVAQNWGNLKSG